MYNQNAKNFYMALYEGSLNVNKHIFYFKNFICYTIILPTLALFFYAVL